MNSMIQTIDLTKKFGDFTANDHINLDVKEQEIKCIGSRNCELADQIHRSDEL